jgi:hypothetical protein
MAHDCADRAVSEAAGYWAFAAGAHYGAREGRGCVPASVGTSRTARNPERAWAALRRGGAGLSIVIGQSKVAMQAVAGRHGK